MNKYIFFLFYTFWALSSISQTISGKIENNKGEKILFANVIIKDSINAYGIKEFVIARNGYYSITLTKKYTHLVLEVSANNYQKDIFIIDSFISSKDYTHDFFLVRDTIFKLQDVIVTAKVRPFQIKGDTVNYNVSAYRDGTERKIQDVIRKLPGIEINEKTGEIKYRGKSVETVKLDGEDLFASNYTIGTKNINVDMVEQVQAIENYTDNPLLKGIESGDKVALNLTLKKRRADYSVSMDLGVGSVGSNVATDAATNILGIGKKYKSFATASFNNIGINSSPFDYFAYNPNFEQLKESGLLAVKYIPDTYFNTNIDAKRSNVNNAFFGSYNAVFKIGKRLSIKSNLYYLNDKIRAHQLNVASNNINGQEFKTSDQNTIIKKPTQMRGDLEAKYNISNKSLLEYAVQYKDERINTKNNVLQNNTNTFNTSLATKDNYFKQTLTYTTKISERKAIQLLAKHTLSEAPQNISYSPAVFDPVTYLSNTQSSGYKKEHLIFMANLLGSRSKGKYMLTTGTDFRNIKFFSDLTGELNNNTTSVNGFQNKFHYKQSSLYINANYKFQYKKFRFTPAIKLSALSQDLTNNVSSLSSYTSNVLFEPSLSVVYKLNNKSGFFLSSGYNQTPFTEDYFVTNPVIISSRIIKANEFNFHIQTTKTINLLYLINNLYKQFQLNIGANYLVNEGNYFSNIFIQQTNTKLLYFFLPENNKLLSLNFMIEKYLPFIQSTMRFRSDYSKNLYKNIVNNSSLRNNIANGLTNEIFFKTAFDWKINFENTFRHRIINSIANGNYQFKNQSIHNNFQVIIKPSKRVFIMFSTDYYLPNLSLRTQEYFFFDTDLSYQTKNKTYDFRFKARNITNNKFINQFDTNDYSTSVFQTNLLEGHFLFSVSRNF